MRLLSVDGHLPCLLRYALNWINRFVLIVDRVKLFASRFTLHVLWTPILYPPKALFKESLSCPYDCGNIRIWLLLTFTLEDWMVDSIDSV